MVSFAINSWSNQLNAGFINKNLKYITLRGSLFWRLIGKLTINTLATFYGFNYPW
jgi:hypothetical protein